MFIILITFHSSGSFHNFHGEKTEVQEILFDSPDNYLLQFRHNDLGMENSTHTERILRNQKYKLRPPLNHQCTEKIVCIVECYLNLYSVRKEILLHSAQSQHSFVS